MWMLNEVFTLVNKEKSLWKSNHRPGWVPIGLLTYKILLIIPVNRNSWSLYAGMSLLSGDPHPYHNPHIVSILLS